MALPASTASLADVLTNIKGMAQNIKSAGQNDLAVMQAGSIDANFVFKLLDNLNSVIVLLNGWAATTGINAYATANLPGYAGTLTTDITTVVNAAQACINWTVTNFPKDSGGFIQALTLNADGSRTPASFTSAQTAGLQTTLQALIATVG